MFPAASLKRSTGIMGKTITISHTYNPFLHGAIGALREPSESPPGALQEPRPPTPHPPSTSARFFQEMSFATFGRGPHMLWVKKH